MFVRDLGGDAGICIPREDFTHVHLTRILIPITEWTT